MRAAKEAGVFLLFACAEPGQGMPESVEGVRLVLLPEGLKLEDVVRWVNRICADAGVTEFRWRESQRRFRVASLTATAHSPDLPEALAKSHCPVGFIGRNSALHKLCDAAADDHRLSRSIVAVIAPPRAGKTTLLSQFASQQVNYPVWFSFRRGQITRQNMAQLQEAVCEQIKSRYRAVPLSSTAVGRAVTSNDDPSTDLKHLIDGVQGRIDILVDGLDEVESPEESRAVLAWLQQMPSHGVVVIGTQPIPAIDAIDCSKIDLQNGSEAGQSDARKLIASFARRFNEHAHLCDIAHHLQEDRWVDGLVERAGANLWMLTEFLSAVENDRAGWPDTPSDAGLSADVRLYCQKLAATALAGYDHATRPLVERFLAFRSSLGNQPWNVADVVALTGDSVSSAPFGAWSGTGVLTGSTRRVINFDGGHCRFWSPLTHEAVRSNYQTYAKVIAARVVAHIREVQSESEFANHLRESIPMLLSEVGDAGMVRELLFDTSCARRTFGGDPTPGTAKLPGFLRLSPLTPLLAAVLCT